MRAEQTLFSLRSVATGKSQSAPRSTVYVIIILDDVIRRIKSGLAACRRFTSMLYLRMLLHGAVYHSVSVRERRIARSTRYSPGQRTNYNVINRRRKRTTGNNRISFSQFQSCGVRFAKCLVLRYFAEEMDGGGVSVEDEDVLLRGSSSVLAGRRSNCYKAKHHNHHIVFSVKSQTRKNKRSEVC